MRYTVLHAFLTYRVYKRLYLSALNLVNFLKTPYTTAPERVRVVFRCRRFTRTQSSRNSALPFLFCTNEPHLSALLPMQSNPMRRQDTFPVTGFFIQKESCVTFFLPPFFFCPLRPPPHPAVKQSFLPPHSSRIRPFGYFPASIPEAVLHQTVVSFRLIQKKRQPRRGLPQIFRVGGITASQALFRRP